MRRYLIPIIAAGAILITGALPAAAASSSSAAPAILKWGWKYHGQYPTYQDCVDVGYTFSPWSYKCPQYNEGDYFIFKLYVYQPLNG
jgi:hypothetical protein